jgi:hypothetical protein
MSTINYGFKLAEALKIGDTFYECDYGINIKFVVNSIPQVSITNVFGKDRTHISWTSTNCDGTITNHSITEGMDCYGPRIYTEPQYVTIVDGSPELVVI